MQERDLDAETCSFTWFALDSYLAFHVPDIAGYDGKADTKRLIVIVCYWSCNFGFGFGFTVEHLLKFLKQVLFKGSSVNKLVFI